jgi:predicted nucleotidyltransferase
LIAKRVKEIINLYDPQARVIVFGSVVRGEYTASSDIDILVITEKINMKYDIMAGVYKELVYAPIELHIVSPELYDKWYRRFIKPDEMLEL